MYLVDFDWFERTMHIIELEMRMQTDEWMNREKRHKNFQACPSQTFSIGDALQDMRPQL